MKSKKMPEWKSFFFRSMNMVWKSICPQARLYRIIHFQIIFPSRHFMINIWIGNNRPNLLFAVDFYDGPQAKSNALLSKFMNDDESRFFTTFEIQKATIFVMVDFSNIDIFISLSVMWIYSLNFLYYLWNMLLTFFSWDFHCRQVFFFVFERNISTCIRLMHSQLNTRHGTILLKQIHFCLFMTTI